MSEENIFQVTTPTGGGAAKIRARSAVIFGCIWLLGAMPTILDAWLGIPVPSSLQVFGWGLWMPGAGFVAVGGWSLLWVPIVLFLFAISMLVWAYAGMLAAPLFVWLLSAIVAALIAPAVTAWYGSVIIPVLGLALVVWRFISNKKRHDKAIKEGKLRAPRMAGLRTELARKAEEAPDPRELTPEQIEASRYAFDLTQQPVGSFEGFTRIDNFQAASLRYQLNYLSYAFCNIQYRYTPNFHGYLNKAQQFAIDSLTVPKVCSFWKWEKLFGSFRWNPDPADIDNVMLTGWSQIGIAVYTANTGDQRYHVKGSLPFKTSKSSRRTYDHDAHSFTKSIVFNWNRCPTTLYPCEPHWVYPICNTAAYAGVAAYDRANGTNHIQSNKATFLQHFKADFLLPDGKMKTVLNSLLGWDWLTGLLPAQVTAVFLLQMSRMATVIDMDLARQWYIIAREEYFNIDGDGRIQLIGFEWDKLVDGGNYRKGVADLLGPIAVAAREHGDVAMAEAALREADERLTRINKPGVCGYEGASNAANIWLIIGKLTQRDDWRAMIQDGPSPETKEGPLLTDCRYPDVLVAAAHGNADGLHLVLYPGVENGEQKIKIERLKENSVYQIEGAIESKIELAAGQTSTILSVLLKGRTEVTLRLTN